MNDAPISLLVVDDDPSLLAVLEAGLNDRSDHVVTATTQAEEAESLIRTRHFDLLVTDYILGHDRLNGIELLRRARERDPQVMVIIITAFASLEISLQAIHLGAYDFLTKPFQLEELKLVVRNATHLIRLNRENTYLRQQIMEMIEALREVEQSHAEWVDRIKKLDAGASITEAPSGLEPLQASPLRRKLIQEQIATYVKMGESLRDQLNRQRQRIQALVEQGLLPESAYQRAMQPHRGEEV